MQTKQEFHDIIYRYYANRIGEKISSTFLNGLTERITDHYYEQYSRFRIQYPKSVKRYSTFKIDDLEHPEVTEIVINYFKEVVGDNYAENAMIVLGLPLPELRRFEEYREAYHNK
jgi:hypothetical protein